MRIAAISPASALSDAHSDRVAAGVARLRDLGHEVTSTPARAPHHCWLAGSDAQRADELLRALMDSDLDAIIATRGGYGCTRVLSELSGPWPTQDPFLIGFSDLTALLWSRYAAGFRSGVHGPALVSLATQPVWAIERLNLILGGMAVPPLVGIGWGGGLAEGPVLPGNLSVATALIGTRHLPSLDGVILVVEDTNEAPYRIDRMLTQWRDSRLLDGVAGIGLGRFANGDRADEMASVLRDRLSDLGVPIISALAIGHDGPNASLVVGARCEIDGDEGTLRTTLSFATSGAL